MTQNYNHEKMFTYIKGMARGLRWSNTMKALYIARAAHIGQTRKSGEPYLVHPLTVACHALALGVRDDDVIAACILHDYVEDCDGELQETELSETVCDAIMKLSFFKDPEKDKQEQLKAHYEEMRSNRIACLVKLFDRANNVSTMAGVFTEAKLEEYIAETRTYVLPLLRYTKDVWPEMSDALFALKYHITSVIDAIEATMNCYPPTNHIPQVRKEKI